LTTHNFPSMAPFTDDDIWLNPEFLLNGTHVTIDEETQLVAIIQVVNTDTSDTVTIFLPIDKMRGLGRLLDNVSDAFDTYDGTDESIREQAEQYGAVLPNENEMDDALNELLGGN